MPSLRRVGPLAPSRYAGRVKTSWLCALLFAGCAVRAPAPQPRLHGGHAHNDYLHRRALQDALQHGFASAEADIFLIDGELRVGHERWLLRPGTLQSLYLEPLRLLAAANHGRITADGTPFCLLVDIKADGDAVYLRLREVLAEYRDMLTVFRDKDCTPGAVSVILSGSRPRRLVATEPERLCALDGRPEDLDRNPSPFLVPWISDAWSKHFGRGTEELDAAQLQHLRSLVARTHAQGRKLRFWGAPDRAEVWSLQRREGVDLINTDRLLAYAQWVATEPATKP